MESNRAGEFDLKPILKRIVYENDEKAFSVFFDRYHSQLLRFAKLYVHSIQEAEDVVSDVLVKMLRHDRSAFLKENFIAYLYASIKNQCFDQIKRHKKSPTNVDANYDEKDYFIFDDQTPLTKLIQSELTGILSKTIEELPPKRRMVFKMIKDENMSHKEVAALMDISDRTVEVHLKLALQDVRKKLEEYLQKKSIDKDQHRHQLLSMVILSLSIGF